MNKEQMLQGSDLFHTSQPSIPPENNAAILEISSQSLL